MDALSKRGLEIALSVWDKTAKHVPTFDSGFKDAYRTTMETLYGVTAVTIEVMYEAAWSART